MLFYCVFMVSFCLTIHNLCHDHRHCCVTFILLCPKLSVGVCVCVLVCLGSMNVDIEGIIQCIKQGDENGVQIRLQEFNKEVM